ncbi:VanZ family protein [Kineococcus glutinatus]|uniref:VanZ family protein n=1 Tax=Kineococcus glutinatus TaxID=1070872 RepID=A0ABP8VHK4_9ACTN
MRRRLPAVAFAAAVLLSAVVLFAPDAGRAGGVPHLDKVVHGALFALLTATGTWWLRRPAVVCAGAGAYAVLSEVVQHVALPNRAGDLTDVAADASGVLLAALGALLVRRRARSRGR